MMERGLTRHEAYAAEWERQRREREDATERWCLRAYAILAALLLLWSASHGGM